MPWPARGPCSLLRPWLQGSIMNGFSAGALLAEGCERQVWRVVAKGVGRGAREVLVGWSGAREAMAGYLITSLAPLGRASPGRSKIPGKQGPP